MTTSRTKTDPEGDRAVLPDLLPDERVEALLARFGELRLLVVGDAFLDEYLFGDASRVSPEAPVPVVHVKRESSVLGGAANVVRNLVALGARCEFCSAVGDDSAGERVLALLEDLGVGTAGVVRVADRPTTHKMRIVARRQQVVRVDRESVEPLPEAEGARVVAAVESVLPGVQSLVIEDYAKGLLSTGVARPIMRAAGAAGVPVNVDPKLALEPFAGAALVKPNLAEAEALSGLPAAAGLEPLARELQKVVAGADLAISRGADGLTLFEAGSGGQGVDVPTVPQEVYDVQGAGDTIIAVLSLARAAGASLWEAAVLANAAASVVVGKTGTATADRRELRHALPAVREVARAAARRAGDGIRGAGEVGG